MWYYLSAFTRIKMLVRWVYDGTNKYYILDDVPVCQEQLASYDIKSIGIEEIETLPDNATLIFTKVPKKIFIVGMYEFCVYKRDEEYCLNPRKAKLNFTTPYLKPLSKLSSRCLLSISFKREIRILLDNQMIELTDIDL